MRLPRVPTHLHLFLGILAGWRNRHQQSVIEYLQTENEILKRQLNGRRLRLTDHDRRRLSLGSSFETPRATLDHT